MMGIGNGFWGESERAARLSVQAEITKIPPCQRCGKKIYSVWGVTSYSIGDHFYHSFS